MWHAIWHAFLESLQTLPILFLAYVLIEFIEVKTSKTLQHSKVLHSHYAPLIGAGIGLIPQCGFSVVATDLYTKKKISVGTLLAMYIATSDEAIPILLSYPDQYKNLALILGIKFGLALLIGYLTNLFLKYIYKPKPEFVGIKSDTNIAKTASEVENSTVSHSYFVGEVHIDEPTHVGCCGHDIESENKKQSFWRFIYHPLKHCLKIFAFILLVNVVFGLLIHFVGEETIASALNSTKYFQPILAGLVGLIPNCAASVVITNLFAMGGLSLGACIAGLIANAGLGLTILVKQNTNKKHTIFIIVGLYLISVITGTIVTLIA